MALGDCSLAIMITSSRVKLRVRTCAVPVNVKQFIRNRSNNPVLYLFTVWLIYSCLNDSIGSFSEALFAGE